LKRNRYQYLIGLILSFNLLNTLAQVPTEQARSTDTITYYIINPHGNNAEITWTITGGTIVGHPSPYTADGADTIQVIWNDSNKTSANYGLLKVSEIVKWPGGISCPSPEEQINVESWSRPKAKTDTSDLIICPGESFAIKIDFEGKPGYRYKWKLYDRDNPTMLIEDHTAEFITSINPSTDILIAGIENNTGTEKMYEFEITDVQDALNDSIPGDVSMAGVSIYVQPKTSAGMLKNSDYLIRR
jgi:hypothetical protein